MPNGITCARLLAAGALAVLLLALGWAVANGLDEDDAASQAPPTRETVATTTRPKPTTPPAARARFVKLTAAGAFDPEGDGHERDEEASLAVDGNRSTFWRTERYSRFFKTGVGLVLDAGRRRSRPAGGRRQRHAGRSGGDPDRQLAHRAVHPRLSREDAHCPHHLPRRGTHRTVRGGLGHRAAAGERRRGGRGTRPRHLRPVA